MRKSIIAVVLLIATSSISNPSFMKTKIANKEIKCLVDNIYHESRGEPFQGQILVGRVTLNRASTDTSICSTVYAKKQFSWTNQKGKKITDKEAYKKAHDAAMYAIYDKNHNILYFHAKHVKPEWRKKKQKVKQVGNHIFYAN